MIKKKKYWNALLWSDSSASIRSNLGHKGMHNVHVLLESAILTIVAAKFVGTVLAIFVAIALINAVNAQTIATLELVRGAGSC